MFKRVSAVGTAIALAISLTGCVNDNAASGDVYSASEAKQVQSVSYGTLVSVRAIKIQGDDNSNIVGALGGAILGGLVGNTIGGGAGRSVAAAGGAVLGGVAGQKVQSGLNTSNGVELEIRKDDGNTIMVVQKQAATRFSVGQRVVLATNGSRVTVSPRN